MELKKIFIELDKKLEQGVTELPMKRIGEEGYGQLISDISATLDLMDKLNSQGKPKQAQAQEVKVGTAYTGMDGNEKATRIVVFTKNNCSYCEAMKPVIIPVLEEANVEIEYVNISEEDGNELAGYLGINAAPSYLFVKDGMVTNHKIGFDTTIANKDHVEEMVSLLKEHL